MKNFNYKGLVFFSAGMIFLTLINPVAAQAAASPTAKISTELKAYYKKSSSYLKVNPSRIFVSEGNDPNPAVITRDSLGNTSVIDKNYHRSYIDGFVYSDNLDNRTPLALKVAKLLGLNTTARLSKITDSYWSPAEINFKIWSSPVYNYDPKVSLASERNLVIVPEIIEAYIGTLSFSKGASMKLSNNGSTRTYSWNVVKNKLSSDVGKVTIIVEKGLITQFTFYSLEKKSYKLATRFKFEFKNYPVSVPTGPYLEYDEILAFPEFTEKLYEDTARDAFTSVWNIILSNAIKHSILGEGLYVTVDDINSTLSSYNNPYTKFTQYTQAIEIAFKSVKGPLIYVCSTLPVDVMATDILKSADGEAKGIPYSITYKSCSELGYTLSNQGA